MVWVLADQQSGALHAGTDSEQCSDPISSIVYCLYYFLQSILYSITEAVQKDKTLWMLFAAWAEETDA